ncbi:MAG: UDP-N-acetylmuramoyl-tripeptide--D-alanyl-D-alanine ligase [Bradymonadaceae bacterium]|nr:UDP-N-acetylmuramoyl-tripeptide--D-alanyl-D-alanine ligase [Lujinxingiaceae bacterium]
MNSTLRIATWTLGQIADAIGGEIASEHARALSATGVSTDTRQITPGALFVALSGPNFDAHDFLGRAAELGATAAIVAHGRAASIAGLVLIEVDDPERALGDLGRALWLEATAQGMHTVAVTGSNGKTTVKEILANLWSGFGVVHATRGNLNNHIGVPLTLCALPLVCDHLIVEMGANAVGDIERLIQLAPASERIITSIGYAHVEGFGSLEGVRRAKSEIFLASDANTAAIVPYEERLKVKLEGFAGRILTFGGQAEADVRYVLDAGAPAGSLGVRIEVDSRKWTLSLPLLGVHNADNLAAAFATLIARGVLVEESDCALRLTRLTLPQGRWRIEQVGGLHFIDDAYNANPSSVRASFDAFMGAPWPAGQLGRVAIVGEMLELGVDSARHHEEVARHIGATKELSAFVAVGTHAQAMAQAAAEVCSDQLEIVALAGIEEVVVWLRQRPSALVLLKASRGSRLERVIEALKQDAEGG